MTPERRSDGPDGRSPPAGGAGRPNPVRRLYDWVVGWADRPAGPAALTGLAAAEAVFFPIPPDVLLIPLCLGRPRRSLRFALLCTLGSLAGAVLGYWIGDALYASVGQPILELYGYQDVYRRVGDLYQENLVATLGAAGFTPIPFKVFTLAAGGFRVPLLPFLVVSACSRAARFFLVAGLLRVFGDPIREFIERWFNLLTVLLAALVVLGFLAVRWIL